MRTISHKVYHFSELSDEAKEKAIEANRDINTNYDWWDNVYYDATTVAASFGLEIDRIFFSGFWSRGDGARFVGTYRYKKGALAAVKAYAPLDTELHGIVERLQAAQSRRFYGLVATADTSGRYEHSGCMSVDVDIYDPDRFGAVDGQSERDIRDNLRWFADWIYTQLEAGYQYRTSDDAVTESLICGGYEFYENGGIV